MSLVNHIAECIRYLEECKSDREMTKDDLCDAIRERMCVFMSKVVSYPIMTNFALPVIDSHEILVGCNEPNGKRGQHV
jgi:hypothetical protein